MRQHARGLTLARFLSDLLDTFSVVGGGSRIQPHSDHVTTRRTQCCNIALRSIVALTFWWTEHLALIGNCIHELGREADWSFQNRSVVGHDRRTHQRAGSAKTLPSVDPTAVTSTPRVRIGVRRPCDIHSDHRPTRAPHPATSIKAWFGDAATLHIVY